MKVSGVDTYGEHGMDGMVVEVVRGLVEWSCLFGRVLTSLRFVEYMGISFYWLGISGSDDGDEKC